MPTTSRPQRPSRSKAGNASQVAPIKGIQLKIFITGPGSGELKRLAASKGLKMEERGTKVYLVIPPATPEEALAKLGILSGLLASKP